MRRDHDRAAAFFGIRFLSNVYAPEHVATGAKEPNMRLLPLLATVRTRARSSVPALQAQETRDAPLSKTTR